MKTYCPKYLTRILTLLTAMTTASEMKADGRDRVIPISDEVILVIQIGLVIAAVGVVFLFASLLRSLVKKRNLPEPKSYFLIVLATFLIVALWNWIIYKMNPSEAVGFAITPISILIIIFTPILLYRFSPKKKSSVSKNLSNNKE